jgi:hypothetical protein
VQFDWFCPGATGTKALTVSAGALENAMIPSVRRRFEEGIREKGVG